MKKYCSLVLSLRAMYATAQDAVATLQNDMICKNRGQFSNIKSACRKNVSRQREITLNGDILRFADIRTTDIRQMRKPFKVPRLLYPYPLSGATSFVFADPVNGNMAVPVTSRSGKNAHTQMFYFAFKSIFLCIFAKFLFLGDVFFAKLKKIKKSVTLYISFTYNGVSGKI